MNYIFFQSSSEISETGGSIAKRPRFDDSAAESHQNSKKHAGQPGGQLQHHQQQAGAMVAGGGLGPALQVGGNFRPWSEDVSAAAAAAAAATAAAAETARRGHYYQSKCIKMHFCKLKNIKTFKTLNYFSTQKNVSVLELGGANLMSTHEILHMKVKVIRDMPFER